MKGPKVNIQLYFVLIVICFAFGQIQQIINNFSGVLGWVFIIITAGLFFYAGGDLVDQGVFSTKKWKVAFVVLLPIVFFVDVFLIKKLSWYHGSSGVAYYMLYTLGFLFKRLPTLDLLIEDVFKYKIVEKYKDDPQWATYLYFKNGEEAWNQTIPGSFLAKNPDNDLTFVHHTKEEAIRHARNTFKNVTFVED